MSTLTARATARCSARRELRRRGADEAMAFGVALGGGLPMAGAAWGGAHAVASDFGSRPGSGGDLTPWPALVVLRRAGYGVWTDPVRWVVRHRLGHRRL